MKKLLLFCLISTSSIFTNSTSQNNCWASVDYIWNYGIISECDHGLYFRPFVHFKIPMDFHAIFYSDIKQGDIVWVKPAFLARFYKEVLPSVKNQFILVVCDGDNSFPTDCGFQSEKEIESLINHPSIIHIFAQNCDYPKKTSKITHLPIGIDFHTVAYKQGQVNWGQHGSPKSQVNQINSILKNLKPTFERKLKAFIDFQHSDSMLLGEFGRFKQFGETRTDIFNKLVPSGLVDHSHMLPRAMLWETKGQYAFSISPPGNGLDCHRTWEDLVLGCIVIVKSSPIDPMFEGLPVVIINDWSEVNEENFKIWIKKYGDAFENPKYREKLTHQYWMNKIKSYQTEIIK